MNEFESMLANYFAQKGYGSGAKAPTGTPTTNYTHGPGGLFGVAGISDPVISGHIAPMGISELMQVNGTIYTDPLYPYITGYEETGTRTEPTGVCDTCVSGETEACLQTAPLGHICRESKEISLTEIQRRINRGEFDLTVVNQMLHRTNDPLTPQNLTGENALNLQLAWAMHEVGIFLRNKLAPLVWQGNPTNNTSGGGYREFIGLDTLIGVNKYDAITGTRCQALDSDVKDFNYRNINYVDGGGNFLIVEYINAMATYLKHNAERMGLSPTKHVLAMRTEAWLELLKVWPLAYYSTRGGATLPTNVEGNIDMTRVAELREEMRNGKYIDTAAGRIPVVTDDGIFEYNSTNSASVPAGSFASSIYFVPLSYLGSRKGTYLEYMDFNGVSTETSKIPMVDDYWVSDGGRFIWTTERKKLCYTISGVIEPRIVLRVPQLAGKITSVLYAPTQHMRDYDQDSEYFMKGGVNSRTAPSLYSDWNTP